MELIENSPYMIGKSSAALRNRYAPLKQFENTQTYLRSTDSIGSSRDQVRGLIQNKQLGDEPSSIEEARARDLGEIILKVLVPYKSSRDVNSYVLREGLNSAHRAITKRPEIGHSLPIARLRLPHGSAFMTFDNDKKAKEFIISVFDPAVCAHPHFQKQCLRHVDMEEARESVQSIVREIDRSMLGYQRTIDDQQNNPLEKIAYEKELPYP